MEEPKEAKIIATKKWTIEINFYDDGSQRLKRTNEGFNPYELLGLSFKSLTSSSLSLRNISRCLSC